MLDVHAKMLFVASRVIAPNGATGAQSGTPAPDSRVNHVTDRVRLIAPRKPC